MSEAQRLTVNKWQSQDHTETPTPRSLLVILSSDASGSLASGSKEPQSHECVEPLYSAQKSRQQGFSSKEKDIQRKLRTEMWTYSWQKASCPPCAARCVPAGRHWLETYAALQPPLEQSLRMQPFARLKCSQETQTQKHYSYI